MGSQRKGDQEKPVVTMSPFSPVRFVHEKSRNTGIVRVFQRKVNGVSLQSRLRGGEGGIRLPPFLASANESYA